MELVAFIAVGLVLGAVAIYSEWFEPSSTARTPTATALTSPAPVPPVSMAEVPRQSDTSALTIPPIIEPAAGPSGAESQPVQRQPVQQALMMVPRPEPVELPRERPQSSRQDRRAKPRAEPTRQAALGPSRPQMIEPAAGPSSAKPQRSARNGSRKNTPAATQMAAAPVQPSAPPVIPDAGPDAGPVGAQEQLAQAQPDRSRPVSRGGQPIYAAETPEGLMDLACFELISGDRSFVGPQNGAFLAKFDIERVAVTCRYGMLQGPATYVLSPNRIYGFNGTIWANVWRMLPQTVRELRVRFEPREASPDRRPRSPRRSSVWDGDAVGFDPQGRVLLMARFDQGNFDGPLQVRTANGTTIFSGNFKSLPEGGVPHGVFSLANQTGRVVAKRYFCNGYPVGVHQFYSTRGEVIAREDYRPAADRADLGDCPWRNEDGSTKGRRSANSGA